MNDYGQPAIQGMEKLAQLGRLVVGMAPGMGLYDGYKEIKAGNMWMGAAMVASEVPALKLVKFAKGAVKEAAQFGRAASSDYRATFFAANPEFQGTVKVHHAVEQQALSRYPGVVSETQMHSLENLRGIPNELNSTLHLSDIRKSWNQFYRTNPSPTTQSLLDHATKIDDLYGHLFTPPVR